MFQSAKKSMMMLPALVLAAMTAACSVGQSFSNAAGPLAEKITGEVRTYASKLDEPARTDETTRANELSAAVAAGDRDAAEPLWFGDPPGVGDSVRGFYLVSLTADPTLKSADGQVVLELCLHDVELLDYVMRVGEAPPESNAAGRSP